MKTRITLSLLASTALLAACGGGGGGSDTPRVPDRPPPPPTVQETTGLGDHGQGHRPLASDALGGETSSLRNGAALRAGTWRDPQGRDGSRSGETLVRYFNSNEDRATYVSPDHPVTIFVHGATASERGLIDDAVAEINRALPQSHRVSVASGDPNEGFMGSASLEAGRIKLFVTSGQDDWADWQHPNVAGRAIRSVSYATSRWEAGMAVLDRNVGGTRMGTIRQEIMHAWGLMGSIPNADFRSTFIDTRGSSQSTASSISTSIDGEALLAMSRMAGKGLVPVAGQVDLDDFGPWSDTSFHVTGTAGQAQFGVSHRNGLAKAWVHGDEPSGHVRTSVTGTATWTGALAGFTDAGHTVTGDAAITVDVAAMSGTAAFDGLESWGPEGHPGTPGDGQTWSDGDLRYTLGVSSDGLGFASTGGDTGTVTGVFLGASHEGAGGTLERSDLRAAFGASR